MTKTTTDSTQQSVARAKMLLEKINGALFWISLTVATNFSVDDIECPDVCECYLQGILWSNDIYGMVHFHATRIDVTSPLIGSTPEEVLAKLNDILIIQRMPIDVYQKGDRILPVQAIQEIARYQFSSKDGDRFVRCGESLVQQVI